MSPPMPDWGPSWNSKSSRTYRLCHVVSLPCPSLQRASGYQPHCQWAAWPGAEHPAPSICEDKASQTTQCTVSPPSWPSIALILQAVCFSSLSAPRYLLKASSNPPLPLFPSSSLLFPSHPQKPLARKPPIIRVAETSKRCRKPQHCEMWH